MPAGRRLDFSSGPLVMGVLNVTPDSFSDGGRWLAPDDAVRRGVEMAEEGADLIDLGAESTRPSGSVYGAGAEPVALEEELNRLLPVLEGLQKAIDLPISVDTRKAKVARETLARGADLVNDVTALADPEMGRLVAETGCPVVLMHSRGDTADMQEHAVYDDVVLEVVRELEGRVRGALAAGVLADQIIVDPGLGFAKKASHNLTLLRHLDAIADLGYPLLVGASRKSFIGAVTGRPPTDRLAGSLAAAGWAVLGGADILRVHDVAATRRFVDVWRAVDGAVAT